MSRRTKSPFQTHWASQTELGKPYGLYAVAVGKLLTEAGLRDPGTKAPTPSALAEGWARPTPLKDGTSHFMWSREKARGLFSGHSALSPEEVWANEVRATLRRANELIAAGEDKLGFMLADFAYDEIPTKHRAAVRALVEGDS